MCINLIEFCLAQYYIHYKYHISSVSSLQPSLASFEFVGGSDRTGTRYTYSSLTYRTLREKIDAINELVYQFFVSTSFHYYWLLDFFSESTRLSSLWASQSRHTLLALGSQSQHCPGCRSNTVLQSGTNLFYHLQVGLVCAKCSVNAAFFKIQFRVPLHKQPILLMSRPNRISQRVKASQKEKDRAAFQAFEQQYSVSTTSVPQKRPHEAVEPTTPPTLVRYAYKGRY